MSWIERSVEQRLANAVAAGELDTPELDGTPLDLDVRRGPGWWADRFARRELSHDRRRTADRAAGEARVGFWRAGDVVELRARVREANEAIERANVDLVEVDRLAPFDVVDIEHRWRAFRRPR